MFFSQNGLNFTFRKMKYDFKGHLRSKTVILKFQNQLLIYFVKSPIFLIHFKNINIIKMQIFH